MGFPENLLSRARPCCCSGDRGSEGLVNVPRSRSWFLEELDWRPARSVCRVPLLPIPILDGAQESARPCPSVRGHMVTIGALRDPTGKLSLPPVLREGVRRACQGLPSSSQDWPQGSGGGPV